MRMTIFVTLALLSGLMANAQSNPISPGSSVEKAVAATGGAAPVQNKVVAGLRGGTVVPLSVDSSDRLLTSIIEPGRLIGDTVRNLYSSTNVTTAAYVQVMAATALLDSWCEIFDSSGQTLVFAFGAPGSEVDQFRIFPGGNPSIPLKIPAGTPLSLKAITATASSGEFDLNCYQ